MHFVRLCLGIFSLTWSCRSDVLVSLPSANPPATHGEWADLGLSSRRPIRIESPPLDPRETLQDFPLRVRLPAEDFTDGAMLDGLRVYSGKNLLAHEIDSTVEGVEIWVRAPVIRSDQPVLWHAYFDGTPTRTSTQSVFEPTFVAVYHFDDQSLQDSSRYQNHGAAVEAVWASQTEKGVGGALDLNWKRYRTTSTVPTVGYPEGREPRTLCGHVYFENPAGAPDYVHRYMAYFGGQDEGDGLFMMHERTAIECGGRQDAVKSQIADGWHYLCCSYNGSLAALTDRGTVLASSERSWTLTQAGGQLGSSPLPGGQNEGSYEGLIDEIRVSSVVRSLTWLRVEALTFESDMATLEDLQKKSEIVE